MPARTPAKAGFGATGISDFAARVLDAAEAIPAGYVMSYGDVAEYVGEGGPRQVGRVMALWGGGVPWWRVVHADGSLLRGHEREALRHYRLERTPMRAAADGAMPRLDMRKARWSGGPQQHLSAREHSDWRTNRHSVGVLCWNALRHG